jgi:hypothetical protein
VSYSYTTTSTFTRVHAHYLASKVAADLHLCRLFYGRPTEEAVAAFMEELTELLAGGYVYRYEFGFQRNGQRVVTLQYTVSWTGELIADQDAGRVFAYADVTGAHFYNHLTYSDRWARLAHAERERIEASLPFRRTPGEAPHDGVGYWQTDHSYSAQGVAMQRRTFRPL